MAEEAPIIKSGQSKYDDSTPLRVRRGRVDSVDLYEIKDTELDMLERGSPAGIQLNFAIFLLSIAFSGIVSLVTAIFICDITKIVFILVVIVGILMGGYLLIVWAITRKSISKVVMTIRNRIPAEISLPLGPTCDTNALNKDEPVG